MRLMAPSGEWCGRAEWCPSRDSSIGAGGYPLGVKVSDRELAAVPLRRHDWHGEWNYTVLPAAA